MTTRQEMKGHVNDWRVNMVQENIDTPLLIIHQEGMCKGATWEAKLCSPDKS